MEYGDAITGRGLEHAVALVLEKSSQRPERPLVEIAADAVARTHCVCVTDGEDAAEGRFSDVHRMLIEQVIQLSRDILGTRPARLPVSLAKGRSRT